MPSAAVGLLQLQARRQFGMRQHFGFSVVPRECISAFLWSRDSRSGNAYACVYEPGNLDTDIYCYKYIFNKRLVAFGVVGYMNGWIAGSVTTIKAGSSGCWMVWNEDSTDGQAGKTGTE